MYKKTKVFQIIPNLELGGAEVMVENLSTYLVKDGFEVSVVSLYDCNSAITERLEEIGIPIIYLGKKKGLDIRMFFRLYKLFIKEKPDIIHTHLYTSTYAITAGIFAKVPVKVHTIHSIAKKEIGKVKRRINYLFYKYCKLVPVSISPYVCNSVLEEYKLKESQVPMIFNGIDINRCIAKQDYVGSNERKIIIHIGSFKQAKNHIGLIESFKIVHDNTPNTVLQLIGSGELETTIKDKVKELNLLDCVEFLGEKSNVYPYLSKADLFVLPSLWEGMPLSLIEAMGSGLPVVVTNVGGIPDMVENNISGLIVEVDRMQISDAILKLVNNEKLRREIGQAAKNKSEQFSACKMERDYRKLYLSLLK